MVLMVKNPPVNAEDMRDVSSIPGFQRYARESHGSPLPDSCLKNFMDRETWRATVHGFAKSLTGLSDQYFHFTVDLWSTFSSFLYIVRAMDQSSFLSIWNLIVLELFVEKTIFSLNSLVPRLYLSWKFIYIFGSVSGLFLFSFICWSVLMPVLHWFDYYSFVKKTWSQTV